MPHSSRSLNSHHMRFSLLLESGMSQKGLRFQPPSWKEEHIAQSSAWPVTDVYYKGEISCSRSLRFGAGSLLQHKSVKAD